MIENCGEKTLTFELEQADLNFHLTVAVKVLTCQDCSCIRVLADQGSVLAQLSAAMHDPLPRWSGSVLNRHLCISHHHDQKQSSLIGEGIDGTRNKTHSKDLHIS